MLDVKSQDISIPEAVVVLCTAPDEATAQDLAEKLAACATLLPGATSLYYWEGKLEQEYEVQMILKTTVSHQQALIDCLKSHHPYQTPELLVLPVTHGDTDYLSWLNASLR
ncbi:divalent cation tolerance protein CutA [Salmonella enterica]|uniref:divalent cation tolerance protein CutA n=1 Tax=Salmonella enterica TaxID=28901 RepID=UPI0009AD159D|nr:divalent cation tolerance protein CutA [Salmonella enterica]